MSDGGANERDPASGFSLGSPNESPTKVARLWFACEEPERPTDAFVMWHYRACIGCDIKADMLCSLHPDDPHVAWLRDHVERVDGIGVL